MVRQSLENLITEKSVKDSHNVWTLLLTVLMKYGIAPIALIYFGYILMVKDEVIQKKDELSQKNTEIVISLVREQTTATVKQTAVMENVGKNIEANTRKLEDIERKSK